jgi:hypothetical protein
LGGIKQNLNDFGVTGVEITNVFIRGICCMAPGIANRSRRHAFELPQQTLGTPKAAHSEDGSFKSSW